VSFSQTAISMFTRENNALFIPIDSVEFKRKGSILKLMCCTRQSYDYSGNRGGTIQLELERS